MCVYYHVYAVSVEARVDVRSPESGEYVGAGNGARASGRSAAAQIALPPVSHRMRWSFFPLAVTKYLRKEILQLHSFGHGQLALFWGPSEVEHHGK